MPHSPAAAAAQSVPHKPAQSGDPDDCNVRSVAASCCATGYEDPAARCAPAIGWAAPGCPGGRGSWGGHASSDSSCLVLQRAVHQRQRLTACSGPFGRQPQQVGRPVQHQTVMSRSTRRRIGCRAAVTGPHNPRRGVGWAFPHLENSHIGAHSIAPRVSTDCSRPRRGVPLVELPVSSANSAVWPNSFPPNATINPPNDALPRTVPVCVISSTSRQ